MPADTTPDNQPTILLVEDNPLVRATTQALLNALSYSVVDAPNALDALELLEAHPSIQLIVSDLGLPDDIDGRELARQANAMRPGLPVLLTSGSHLSSEDLRQIGVPHVGFLQKPFPIAQLREAIVRFMP